MMNKAKLLHSVVLALALLIVAPMVGNSGWLLGSTQAHAQSISQISVEGNVRIDDATILSYLTLRVGDTATPAQIESSRQALVNSGIVQAASISMSGNTLVVQVSESASVASIRFEGNQRFTDDQLNTMVEVATSRVYESNSIASDVAVIKSAYDRAGFTNVTVSARTETAEDGRIRVIFDINEGDRAGIAAINFTGNNNIGSMQLQSVITTKETHVLSWVFRDDQYDEDRLAVDRERIRVYYANRGYPDARVLSSVAEFDAERNAYFINFTIEEGERYAFGDIAIETSIDGLNTNALRGEIETRSGNRYSLSDLEDTIRGLAVRATQQGFAFAEVRPRIDRDIDSKTFNVTYLIDEGARVYIERINITGNTKTRDFVIRREFNFSEGDPFNRTLISQGQANVEALGFFSSVQVTSAQGSAADRVVLNVAVVEQRTGEYGIGGGYSTNDGFFGEISLTERNFLGRGQYVKAAIGRSQSGQTYDFSFTEPRFMGLEISSGFDLYRRITEESSTRSFGVDETGGRLRFGMPLTDDLSLTTFVGYEHKDFLGTDDAPPYITSLPSSGVDKLSVGYQLNFNTLDRQKNPTEGLILSFSQEYAGLDFDYLKTEARARYYYPLWEEFDVIGSVRAMGGTINDLGGSGINPTEAFRLGPNFVRGFTYGGMGARWTGGSGDAFGVLAYAGLSAEIDFPIPVLPESWGLRSAVWGDVGWIDGTPDVQGAPSTGIGESLKSSVGASLIWDSPVGPLRGDFAHVINSAEHDNTQVFQFTLSTLF